MPASRSTDQRCSVLVVESGSSRPWPGVPDISVAGAAAIARVVVASGAGAASQVVVVKTGTVTRSTSALSALSVSGSGSWSRSGSDSGLSPPTLTSSGSGSSIVSSSLPELQAPRIPMTNGASTNFPTERCVIAYPPLTTAPKAIERPR